jgi:hypothetical protein
MLSVLKKPLDLTAINNDITVIEYFGLRIPKDYLIKHIDTGNHYTGTLNEYIIEQIN